MSSLAVRCGLEWELGWLRGLFTAAELAAADLLLQLSRDYEAAAAASKATIFPSPRSASSCCEVPVKEVKERVVEETAPLPLGSLDRRASRSSASACLEDLTVVSEEELEPPRIARETAPAQRRRGAGVAAIRSVRFWVLALDACCVRPMSVRRT
ncbi:uncharacterized protein LOC125507511 [Triticum urartu]|uniref:uncharacterized protein LOC125507511 n=1 Tax=Triticum urartu TaxID=4572 RepID=UPI0020435D5E|nr:uncharacterized protein LOC125507511 [Triticum urartu]